MGYYSSCTKKDFLHLTESDIFLSDCVLYNEKMIERYKTVLNSPFHLLVPVYLGEKVQKHLKNSKTHHQN